MATFTPEPRATAPNNITLLDIVKAYNSETGQVFDTRLTNVNTLLSDSIHPLFVNIDGSPYSNEELGAILLELARKTLVNSNEILYLKHLVALITFDLNEQGIELNNKELIQNLEIYLKYR